MNRPKMSHYGTGAIGLWCLVQVTAALAQETPLPYYVGRDVCLECHRNAQKAKACSLESIPAHDRSYKALGRPEADEIAVLCGIIEAPKQSRFCLGCHAAAADAGPRWTDPTFKVTHGVQCEACHDSGSLHVQAARLEPTGETPLQDLIRRSDRSDCAGCHVPRASHEEVLRRGFRREAGDRCYKTPVNMTISRDGQRLYVVCEKSDSVIVLDPREGRVLSEIAVGRRPHGAILSPDGGTLYVTNRLADTLSVFETLSGKVTATIRTGHEPHGVVTDPTGRHIYVLNHGEDSISIIDAGRLEEVSRLAMGRGPWSAAFAGGGTTVYATNLYPHISGFREPYSSELTVLSVSERAVTQRLVVPDANTLQGIGFVPSRGVALFTLMRTKNLVPITRLAQGWTVTSGLGVAWPDGRVDQVLLDEPNASFPDPMDVAVSPDGKHALVTSGGSDQIAVVDVSKLLETIAQASDLERKNILPNDLSASRCFVLKRVRVGCNPRAVVFSPDGRAAYVANALDDSITVLETSDFTVARVIRLGGPAEVTRLRRGERLFHSAEMTFGQQFSCRTCHPQGHTNGLAFDIEADGVGANPLQVRTLRGILDTPPFKWEGTNPTIHAQCGPRLAVFFARLAPLQKDDLDALVRYVSTIERPPNRYRHMDGLTPAQRRGKAVFERTTHNVGGPIPRAQRCTTCHNTPSYTARKRAVVGTTMWLDMPAEPELIAFDDTDSFGYLGVVYFYDTGSEKKAFDAPHLNNIYDRAPYLHNGSAATLEEIWTRFNLYEAHGLTGDLTRRQFNDLIVYLKSL